VPSSTLTIRLQNFCETGSLQPNFTLQSLLSALCDWLVYMHRQKSKFASFHLDTVIRMHNLSGELHQMSSPYCWGILKRNLNAQPRHRIQFLALTLTSNSHDPSTVKGRQPKCTCCRGWTVSWFIRYQCICMSQTLLQHQSLVFTKIDEIC
jgi:hypothetical protein